MAEDTSKVVLEFEARKKGIDEAINAIKNLSGSFDFASSSSKNAKKEIESISFSAKKLKNEIENLSDRKSSEKSTFGINSSQIKREINNIYRSIDNFKYSVLKSDLIDTKKTISSLDSLEKKLERMRHVFYEVGYSSKVAMSSMDFELKKYMDIVKPDQIDRVKTLQSNLEKLKKETMDYAESLKSASSSQKEQEKLLKSFTESQKKLELEKIKLEKYAAEESEKIQKKAENDRARYEKIASNLELQKKASINEQLKYQAAVEAAPIRSLQQQKQNKPFDYSVLHNSANETIAGIKKLTSSLDLVSSSGKNAKKELSDMADKLYKLKTNAYNYSLNAEYRFVPKDAEREIDAIKKKFNELSQAQLKPLNQNVSSSIKEVGMSASKTSSDYKNLEQSAIKANKEISNISKSSGALSSLSLQLKSLAGAYIGLRGFTTVIQSIDSIASMKGRLGNVIKDGKEFSSVWKNLIVQSREMGVSLEANVGSFSAMTRSLKDAGFGSKQLLDMNELVIKSMMLGKPNVDNMNRALYQLSQSFSEGKIRGQEWHSIIQQTPSLLGKIKDGLGLTEQEFKKLSKGGLSLDKFFEGLNKSAENIREEFLKLPMTVTKSWQSFKDAISVALYEIDEASGGTAGLSRILRELSNDLSSSEFKTAMYDFSEFMRLSVNLAKNSADGIGLISKAINSLLGDIQNDVPLMTKALLGLQTTAGIVANSIAGVFAKFGSLKSEYRQRQILSLENDLTKLQISGAKPESIQRTKDKIKELKDYLAENPIIRESISERIESDNQKTIDTLSKALDGESKKRKEFKESLNNLPVTGLTDKKGTIKPPIEKTKKQGGGKSGTERQEDSAEKYIQKIKEEIAALETVDQKERARIEQAIKADGKWGKVSENMKNQLLQYASMKDEAIINKKTNDILKSLNDELKLIGLVGNAYEIESFKAKLRSDGIVSGSAQENKLLEKKIQLLKASNDEQLRLDIQSLSLQAMPTLTSGNPQLDRSMEIMNELLQKQSELKIAGVYSDDQIRQYVEALKEVKIRQEEVADQAKTMQAGMRDFSKEILTEANDWAKFTQNSMQSVFDNIFSSLEGAIKRGESSFKQFALSVGEALTSLILKMAVLQMAQAALGWFVGAPAQQAAAPIQGAGTALPGIGRSAPSPMESISRSIVPMEMMSNSGRSFAPANNSTIIQFGDVNISSQNGDPKKIANDFIGIVGPMIDQKISKNNKAMTSRGGLLYKGNMQ